MRTCNWAEAVDYINQMYGQGLPVPLASLNNMMFSKPGLIEFKVYRSVFRTAALTKLVKRMCDAHGDDYKAVGSTTHVEYEWRISPERSVICGSRTKRGLYIQLKDTGN